jgi:hypothetical protein
MGVAIGLGEGMLVSQRGGVTVKRAQVDRDVASPSGYLGAGGAKFGQRIAHEGLTPAR